MRLEIFFQNEFLASLTLMTTRQRPGSIKKLVSRLLDLPPEDLYFLQDGKLLQTDTDFSNSPIHVVLRAHGGKGGFGSMLRAIGAQIEKTTNREACRDLSGRRLRDINEEQRLKNWVATQAEREKEAAEKKQKKLEKLLEQPKHEFKDECYDKTRLALPDKVEDAVLQGLKASCSSKRQHEKEDDGKKKKPKLWFDEDIGSSGDDDDSSEEECVPSKRIKLNEVPTEDSGISLNDSKNSEKKNS